MQGGGGVEANPNLYVHNVPKDSNEEELRHLFGQFGNVERVRLKVNQKVGPHAVYAFVTFSSTADAQRALSKLQGSDVRGRALRIEFQRTSVAPGGSGGSSGPTHAGAHNAPGGGTYYGGSAWDDGGLPPNSSPSGSSPELRTPHSLSGTFSTQSTTHSTTSYHELFRRDSLNANSQHNAMWGTPSVTGGGGSWNRPGPVTTSENAADSLMPPFKRGRFHSPSSRRPRSPIRSANVLGPDSSAASHTTEILNILGQLKELVSQSHPHALTLVDTLSDMLRPEVLSVPAQKPNVLHPVVGGASERWPYSELSPAQQAMVRDGTLTLNQENNRYLLRLSPLLAPLKPAMFNRRGHPSLSSTAPGMIDTRGTNVVASPDLGMASSGPTARKSVPSDHASMGGFVSQPYVAPPVVQALSKPVESSSSTIAAPPLSQTSSQTTSLQGSQQVVLPPQQQQQQQQPAMTQSVPPTQTQSSSDEANWIAQLNTLPITPASARKDVWQGTLARNEKKKMPVSVKRVAGYIDQFLPASMSTLNISHRSALEEMWKKKIGAIGILEAESPDVSRAFQEYITYFKDKNRAGVARLDRSDYQMVYLLPPGLANLGDQITSNLPTSRDYLLAIVGRPLNVKADGGLENKAEEEASKSGEHVVTGGTQEQQAPTGSNGGSVNATAANSTSPTVNEGANKNDDASAASGTGDALQE